MGQPVRKNIAETHPEATQEKIYTLLVDGNNILRKAMSDTKTNATGIHYGGIYQFLNQLRKMMQKYGQKIDYVYVVFDDENSGILRWEIYHDYKANRDKHYDMAMKNDPPIEEQSEYWKKLNATLTGMQKAIYNKEKKVTETKSKDQIVDENFARERDILLEYFNELFIRWIFNDRTEGDDLIAYYVKNKRPEERIIIMSGDHDLTQLISDTVCVYDPNTGVKEIVSHLNFKEKRGMPYQNVVVEKILLGDSSDNIKGINQLSETRLFDLVPEFKERPVTIDEVKEKASMACEERVKNKKKPLAWQENIVKGVHNGNYDGDFYEINRKLVDLSNPLLTDEAKSEMDEMRYNVQDPDGRSFSNIYSLIKRDGIQNLYDSESFAFFFEPFKQLADKEIRRYKKEMGK